ncbi:Na+/H+ antiporter NhaC family protein [Peribacillus frigoritolerans]|uniref:Na+/H+ antiporter NhaC family protein n=1 Tax=Peribacillus frigoritolerans TaxID=450367 RepID=UPI0010594EE5|nr:Na+/H+ antiporter NhaC family protein [Peribacillus frigoritolerans]TDL76530.1 sodium:proton antiporter [Peribacillus frigoritolerans]
MENAWLSLVPFLIVIALSIWLKEILPGLIFGLLAGSFIVNPDLLGGLEEVLNYVLKTLSDDTNIKIIGFLYLFGGLVGMMKISGGIKGFSEWVGKKVKSERGLLSIIWLSLPFTFMMPMFRIMMIGPVIKSLMEKSELSKQKVGFTMDVSTASTIVLLPAGTAFTGFMLSLVEGGIERNQLDLAPYEIFLSSIPFNFFAIVMLVLGLISTFRKPEKQSRAKSEKAAAEEHPYHGISLKQELEEVKAEPWHLIVPLFLLLGLSMFLLWQDGREKGGNTVFQAFAKADATFVMLLAVFLTLVITFLFYSIRRVPLKETLYHFYDGGNQMMQAIILLILVWALSLSAEDIGFSDFISSTLGNVLPASFVPVIIFLLGSAVGYFIGSSWGTWGLFMPLGISLAVASGASIPLTAGAVFASGAFGAMTSPLGDTTITTASILGMPVVEYARYKLKFTAIGCAAAAVLYAAAGFLLK